jgi:hypothetical protein
MARTDFLTRQRKAITSRLEELRPLYEEYLTLEKAQQALDQVSAPIRRIVGGRGPGRPPTRRTAAKPAAKRAGTSKRASRGRRPGGRADQALDVIKANPGITIPELASKLGIRPNYLYRVTAGLQKERKIRKRGRGFHAA